MDEETINRITEAAAGYVQLGMLLEAAEEIDSLPQAYRELPQVMRIRALLAINAKNWQKAVELGVKLVESGAAAAADYMQAAYCLHEMQRTHEARAILLKAPPEARSDPIYFYNLACYEAVLGHEEKALDYLDQAAAIDFSFRDMAMSDPDLLSIRKYLKP